jgi:hypothetical protein
MAGWNDIVRASQPCKKDKTMDTIKYLFSTLLAQFNELLTYNKTATITVAAVSFVVGAIFF